ncbi:anion permease, partial [Candidatus Fermentibacterales bacterium]|nr:anion permease [Candidatus Fermentibacterales bacterium]
GDPPSMILAASENLGFNDFFFFRGRPGIFFAVELGAVASFFVLYRLMGRDRRSFRAPSIPPMTRGWWIPTALLGLVIAGLALIGFFTPGVGLASGLLCAVGGLLSVVWHRGNRRKFREIPGLSLEEGVSGEGDEGQERADRRRPREILSAFDWDTLLLLAGIFFMVSALDELGIMATIGRFLAGVSGNSPFGAFMLVVWGSVLFSAFVDNVPFVTAMIPVVRTLGLSIGGGSYFYLTFGLLVGSCLGGNISPVGASANIVAVAMLRRKGHRVRFMEFVRIGLPFTVAATAAGSALIWLVWHP